MKNSVKIAVFFILHHLSFVIGVVTISFNSIGYIGQSIVLQCKDTASIGVNSANWYRGGSLLDITSSRYSQTNLSDGFSLTISSLLSTDGGVYHCGIEFGNSATKTLTIYYNTTEKDIVVDGDKTNKAIKITITAFPDPVYNINITEGGTQIFVIWIVTKTTTSNGAIRVLLQNSTAFEDKNYTVIVTITSPVSFIFITHVDFGNGGEEDDHCQDVFKTVVVIGLVIIILGRIIWIVLFIGKGDQFLLGLRICSVIKIIGCIISIVVLALKGYQLRLGLGICFGIIILPCIICIIILVFVKNGDFLRLGLCICSVIKIIVCISCIVILAKNGEKCPQRFLVGFGVGFGILIIVYIIDILILIFFKKVIIQNKDASPRADEKEVTITAIIYGLWISVEWFKEKTILETNEDFTIEPYDNKTRKSSLIIKSSSMKNSATYICRAKNRCGCCSAEDSITLPNDKDKQQAGPPAVHIGTQNKVESNTTSKQTNDRDQFLPPEDTGVEDTPKIRPQPPPPQNSDIKDRNQRGISATIDNPPGLANETPRLNKLPPLTHKQPTVQEEGAAEEPKKKRKKKKKKDQTNEGNPEEEMVEFEITRTVTIVTKNY